MDSTDSIRTLLDRYYDGMATEADEDRLHRYFAQPGIPAELQADKLLFDAFKATDAATPPGLQQRLGRQIDGWNTVEKHTERRARTVSMRWVAGIAASMLALFSLGFYLDTRQGKERYARQADTYDNPQDAYAETQRALNTFAQAIDKGLGAIDNQGNKNKD